MKQCRIRSGKLKDIVWLDKDPKEGMYVTLKDSDDPERLWFIEEVFSTEKTKSELDKYSHRTYHNNI